MHPHPEHVACHRALTRPDEQGIAMTIGSISRFVLSHKRLVVAAWLVIFIASMILIGPAINALSDDFTSPGTESYDANVQVLANFNGTGGITDPVVAVVQLPEGMTVESPGVRE